MRSEIRVLSLTLALLGCAGDPDDGNPSALDVPPEDIVLSSVTTGELTFDVRVAGRAQDEAVILLHGFAETSHEWRHQMKALARAGYRVIAPDQRGYSAGARPEAVEAYAAGLLESDVLAIADALEVQRFHIVGHDLGALVSWAVAAHAGERVLSNVAISVPHPDAFSAQLRDTSSCQWQKSYYFDFFVTPPATDYFLSNDAKELRAVYVGVPPEDADVYLAALANREAMDAALNWYRANISNRVFTMPALGPVRVPTLYIWSDGDIYVCEEGGALSGALVDAPYRFEVLPGVVHLVPENAPEAVSALLLEHLGRNADSR
jgi:pimeloyl-ACP methyl ester carboxylesterase